MNINEEIFAELDNDMFGKKSTNDSEKIKKAIRRKDTYISLE